MIDARPQKFGSDNGRAGNVPAAARDISLVLGTLFAVKSALLQFDELWTYAGPTSILAGVAVASWRLYRNNENWSDLGLKRTSSVLKMLMWSLIALIITMAAGILTEVTLSSATSGNAAEIDPRYSNRFSAVPGNTAPYLYWVVISWIIGGFAEEMLFRAMLISRFERLFSKFPCAVLIAVILQSLVFGQQHYYYQGLNGALTTGAIALVSGVFYICLKRGLWPLILSHGLANMIGLTLIYAGLQPAG